MAERWLRNRQSAGGLESTEMLGVPDDRDATRLRELTPKDCRNVQMVGTLKTDTQGNLSLCQPIFGNALGCGQNPSKQIYEIKIRKNKAVN